MCNLLNNVFPDTAPGGYRLNSDHHNGFKVGDTPTIQDAIDINEWYQKLELHKHSNEWFGTHAHPSAIPNLHEFDEVIVITTQERYSKLQRWLRYYYGWYLSEYPNWQETDSLESIDKIRRMAHNVFVEFPAHRQCKNIEFQDIVSGKFIRESSLNLEYFKQWQDRNPWLYPINEDSWAVKRFMEAEYEVINNLPYRYI